MGDSFEIQGYQGDAAGPLTGREPNELLVSVTLNGNPTNMGVNQFFAVAMRSGLLPAKVVAVREYGGGALGLSLAQERIVICDQALPGEPWPDGPLLFQASIYFFDGSGSGLIQGAALATAIISSPPTLDVDYGCDLGFFQQALQRARVAPRR